MPLLKKKIKDDGYYHVERLEETYPGCKYYMAFGERSNGKTYNILEKVLKTWGKTRKQGAIIRRWDTDFKGLTGRTQFDALVENKLVEKYTGGEYNDIVYYSGMWFCCLRDKDDPSQYKKADEPLCFAFSLNAMEHTKGSSFPNVTIVLFDEFLTRRGYLPDEFVLFQNTLSTIIRDRTDVTIYMMGNTVNKSCPYFLEMGLTRAGDMKTGESACYEYGDSKLKVAVEHTGTAKERGGKPSDVYFAFDNPALSMVTKGDWEIKAYPHKPVKFRPKDIQFTYFICFEDKILQCEIVMFDNYNFTFVHPKTTELKHPETDLIYSQEASPLFNFSRKINQGMNKSKITARIVQYYNNEKVFYSDNSTGEIMRNYMMWCKSANILG